MKDLTIEQRTIVRNALLNVRDMLEDYLQPYRDEVATSMCDTVVKEIILEGIDSRLQRNERIHFAEVEGSEIREGECSE